MVTFLVVTCPIRYPFSLSTAPKTILHDSPAGLLPPVEAPLVDFDINRGCWYACPHSSCIHSTSPEQRDAPFLWTSRCHTCCPSANIHRVDTQCSNNQVLLYIESFRSRSRWMSVSTHFAALTEKPDQKPCPT